VASFVTHFFVGACLGLPGLGIPRIRAVLPAWTIPASAGILAAAPDLDLAIPRLLRLFRFQHNNFFGHRGVFHSPAFLILMAIVLAAIVVRRTPRAFVPLAALWAVCMVSHPLLDALTDHGSPVMLLLPFSTARMFFPWRPLHLAPLGAALFWHNSQMVRRSEIPFCAAAAAIGITSLAIIRGRASFPSESVPHDR
jgi:inner membrane protein